MQPGEKEIRRKLPSDDEIKSIIGCYYARTAQLSASLEKIRKDYRELEREWYVGATIRESSVDAPPPGKRKRRTGDPVLPMLLHKEEELGKQRREYELWVKELMDEKRRVERIWTAYHLLSWEEQQVLCILYEQKRSWIILQREMSMSKSTLVRLRSSAMQHIREMVQRFEESSSEDREITTG
ncbi:MAG: hypothetical protein J6N77_04105 [Lachnospiraceae bacterium]|nr:hypothetical protein [Lachnospiraceae bacterium]